MSTLPCQTEGLTEVERSRLVDAHARLRWGGTKSRVRALLRIVEIQPTGSHDLLVQLLRDRDRAIRVVAAEALANVGDESAIEPLTAALRRCFTGGSGRRHFWVGVAIVAALVIALLALVIHKGAAVLGFGAFGWLAFNHVSNLFAVRRRASVEVAAITSALEAIAARNPTPAVRDVLPELRAVAVDVIQQNAETRRRTREAIERIEALTADVARLPIPGVGARERPDQLPLPAQAAEPSVENAPIPAMAPVADAVARQEVSLR